MTNFSSYESLDLLPKSLNCMAKVTNSLTSEKNLPNEVFHSTTLPKDFKVLTLPNKVFKNDGIAMKVMGKSTEM